MSHVNIAERIVRRTNNMKRLNVLLMLFTILTMGGYLVSCSEDEPTREVIYYESNNESVNIRFYSLGVAFDFRYNVSGIVLSNNRNDLEDMESLGYKILKNVKNEGLSDYLIGNVLVVWAGGWEWYYSSEDNVDDTQYSSPEYNTKYYYRALGYGYSREGGKLVSHRLFYGDIEDFTTPNEYNSSI
jgi:hypothetical protein